MKVYADGLIKGFESANIPCSIEEILPMSRVHKQISSAHSAAGKILNYYERYCLYPRLLKNANSDIFHIVDHTFAYLLNHLTKQNVVVTCHDLILLKLQMGEFGKRRIPFLATYLYRKSIDCIVRARRIISDSDSTKKDLIRLLSIPEEKIRTIHCGLDEAFFRESDPTQTETHKPGNDKFTILHVGGNWFYKNVEGIIISLGYLRKDLRKRTLFLKIGCEFTEDQMALIKKYRLEENVKSFPFSSFKDLINIYRSSDLLLFPSIYEGFGWPPLEAMASGTPVICSDKASLPEVCSDAALYINPNDYNGIAKSVEKIADDKKLREKLIQKGFMRAKLFTWENTARKLYEVYQEILKQND